MNIIGIGHKGMLGRDLILRLNDAGLNVKGLDIDEVDITRPDDLLPRFEPLEPDIIINCAAYTAVDKAESESEMAFIVNRDGPANLAKACKEIRIPLVHISTDYVFNGDADRPYCEEDPVSPIGVYGCSKCEGEDHVRKILKEHVIIRTSWLYGVHGNNFVKTILKLARDRDEIRVVGDQYGCPTWTGELAQVIVQLINQISKDRDGVQWGTYHCCGQGKTTWYEFASKIVEEGRKREAIKVKKIIPITTEEYPTPAKRPSWSVLGCDKIINTFGVELNEWGYGLRNMLDEFYGGGKG